MRKVLRGYAKGTCCFAGLSAPPKFLNWRALTHDTCTLGNDDRMCLNRGELRRPI